MKKKMKFYLPILFILWTGAFIQQFRNNRDLFINTNNNIEMRNAIKKEEKQTSIKNSFPKQESFILFEKEYKGKRSQTEMKEEISFLLAFYKGELVREVFSDNFYSVYGFSDSINNYIVTDYSFSDNVSDYVISEGEKINLNFVITYDEEKDVTYVIGASPFYNEDF